MTNFQLTSGSNRYHFDAAGVAWSSGGEATGAWTTNLANQIVLSLPNTGSITFDVAWVFNDKNQLIIQSQNTEIFNFSAIGLENSFTTRDAALLVKPDRFGTFTFALSGDWGLTPDHNLTFTVGGVTSTLSGFLSDPLGRFMYQFANQDNVLETSVLGFAGFWQSKVDSSGMPLLDFHYRTPSGEGIFGLPEAVVFNRDSNQLAYIYSKGNKVLSLDFQGTLTIGADFAITYVLQRQVSSAGEEMVASSTLCFEATLAKPNLHDDLHLIITKPDGTAGVSTFTIGGEYQGVLGKVNLQVGFTFTQAFGGAGNQLTRTAAFSGALAFNSGQIQWTFSATGTTIDLALGVDIKLGPVQLDVRLNLPMGDGQASGVMFLLGVSF
ncbi:MAG: hypothetical protein JOZ32_14990 [Bryobacterales bacterium]|nr:hypothetical protein [Bryobacterales bacterium]